MNTMAFFNNKGGVGKTTLVYHLAWMFAEMDLSVVAADLDPQMNLTSMFLEDDELEKLWTDDAGPSRTVAAALAPLLEGTGDVVDPYVHEIAQGIGLVVGDLSLSMVEDELSTQWPKCVDQDKRAFRVISVFWRMLAKAAEQRQADVVLIDVGPSLGALNRAALIAASHVVIPLGPDLYSLQGLKNLGPTLRRWREQWQDRLSRAPTSLGKTIELPKGQMSPVGYVVLQHAVRRDRPVKAYQRWLDRVPSVYCQWVLDETAQQPPCSPKDDPHCLAELKHYRSLMPLAQTARKPMFLLTPADGAIGGHLKAARACRKEFSALAETLLERCGIR
ncbi:MAG: chromosome partitioning protein [Candidatus Synechococcus spongiarum 142]|uniref:Chromosome partitioning protein n=1 Tax=Candidatus Synechococcus spongiarum 142 TaxID=1608213 RepID=A0A6N3WXZ5_9SYNE|nr:MAG: chromosome partitioning protein [Candidatus Synechococcus spongiarum 142]